MPINVYFDIKGAYRGAPFNMCAKLCGAGNFEDTRARPVGDRPTSWEYEILDDTIREAFGASTEDIVFKPVDLIRRASKISKGPRPETLRAAVRSAGWPSIRDLRGKCYFVLSTTFGERGTYDQIGDGKRRFDPLMFVRSERRGDDHDNDRENDTVFEETGNPETARRLVRAGYIVRSLFNAGNRNVGVGIAKMIRAGVQVVGCDNLRAAMREMPSGWAVSIAENKEQPP